MAICGYPQHKTGHLEYIILRDGRTLVSDSELVIAVLYTMFIVAIFTLLTCEAALSSTGFTVYLVTSFATVVR